MITCDVFNLHATVDERILRWGVSTDLPGGTRVIVDVSRQYTDARGEKCIWSLWNDAVLLISTGRTDLHGVSGTLNIDDGDAHGLSRFNESLGSYSTGILKPVEHEIRLQITIGARQPIKAFGKNNCNLSGDMVVDSGGINIVRQEAVFSVEMRPEYQPIHEDP